MAGDKPSPSDGLTPGEHLLPNNSGAVAREKYDPFVDSRVEMRGSPIKGEQVCGYIASLWREDIACAIVKISPAEFNEWKQANQDMYARAKVMAAGMVYAEIRAIGLGIVRARYEREMQRLLIKLLDLPLDPKSAATDPSENDEFPELSNMTEEEAAALADLKEM